MSVKISGKVWGLDLPRPEKTVLLAMADHANDDGTKCYPSVGYLAWKTGYSERQVQRAVKALEERGILEAMRYSSGGRGHATEYHIHLVKGVKMSPYIPLKGDISDINGDMVSPIEDIKGDIYDVKGDILSLKGDTMSPQPSLTILEPSVKRGKEKETSFPDDFEVTDKMFNKVRQKHPDLDIDAATETWANNMRAKRNKYRYTDWGAAWYNAMDNAVDWRDEKKEKGGYTDANGHKLNNRSQGVLRQRDALARPRNTLEAPRDGLRLVTGQDTV